MIPRRVGDEKTLNHLLSAEQRDGIDTLWKAQGMRGREPRSYFRKLQRLQLKGVDVSSLAPALWGKPISGLTASILNSEGIEAAHSEWKRDQIRDSLLRADMTAGANSAADSKLDKSRVIIEAYRIAFDLQAGALPRAIAVAKWWIEENGLPAEEKPNLVKRLKRTGLVR